MTTYQLKNEHLIATFRTLGGELISLKSTDGIEYLWQADVTYWGGHSPVLFPICGSLRDDKAVLANGKTVAMPRHGIVRKKEFQCVSQNDTQITFSITSDEEMLTQYPFAFELLITYTLVEKRLTVAYKVVNKTDEEMPYFIGGHPGFNCPLVADEVFEDYELVFEKAEQCTYPKNNMETGLIENTREVLPVVNHVLPLKRELFKDGAVNLDELQSRKVTLQSKKNEHGLTLTFEDFPYLVLWTSHDTSPFIALEPWAGLSTYDDETDNFEQKKGICRISPLGSDEKVYHIDIF